MSKQPENLNDLLEFAENNGYYYITIEDSKCYALLELIFTTAIVVFEDELSVLDRWCYNTADEAKAALTEWGDRGYAGEPDGWIRHPASGRRRDNKGGEWVRL